MLDRTEKLKRFFEPGLGWSIVSRYEKHLNISRLTNFHDRRLLVTEFLVEEITLVVPRFRR